MVDQPTPAPLPCGDAMRQAAHDFVHGLFDVERMRAFANEAAVEPTPPVAPGSYRNARGVGGWKPGDERAEDAIRRQRDVAPPPSPAPSSADVEAAWQRYNSCLRQYDLEDGSFLSSQALRGARFRLSRAIRKEYEHGK